MTAILDTSFLFALTDKSDRNHQRVLTFSQSCNENLVLPVVVFPEICYLIASRLGHCAMRRFIASMTPNTIQVESISLEDLTRTHQILEKYADNQIDFTDAAIVAVAERLGISRIYTLDRRDFSVIRPKHCDYFELIPESL
jgi:uncharacterized protein